MNVATTPVAPATAESSVPRLTELARFAGCAAKISQADLHEALAGLPVAADPGPVLVIGDSLSAGYGLSAGESRG